MPKLATLSTYPPAPAIRSSSFAAPEAARVLPRVHRCERQRMLWQPRGPSRPVDEVPARTRIGDIQHLCCSWHLIFINTAMRACEARSDSKDRVTRRMFITLTATARRRGGRQGKGREVIALVKHGDMCSHRCCFRATVLIREC